MQSGSVNLRQARGNMLPFINGSITHGRNMGRSIDPFTNAYINQQVNFANYGFNGSLSLWNGSSIQNNIKQNVLSYEANKMDLQQQKDNTTINVILAYLDVLNNQEQLIAAMQQAEVTRQQAERLEILNSNGAIAPATFYDMKGQLANDELTVVTVKNTLETAKVTLAQLMNIPYSTAMQLEKLGQNVTPVMYDGTVDQIFAQALEQLAVVKAADLRNESAEVGVKAAKGQLLPTLSLNGGVGTNYSSAAALSELVSVKDVPTNNYVNVDGSKVPVYSPQPDFADHKISYGDQWKNNFNSYVSIGLQIPILNGLQAKSRVNQAKIIEKRTSFEAQTTKTQLRQAIEQAYVNMNSAYQRYLTLTSQVESFTESFKAAEVRFNAGVGTSVDYQIAKNNVDRSRINLIAAKYDFILRTKILDYYQSKPLW
jgi:outer membrane protein